MVLNVSSSDSNNKAQMVGVDVKFRYSELALPTFAGRYFASGGNLSGVSRHALKAGWLHIDGGVARVCYGPWMHA